MSKMQPTVTDYFKPKKRAREDVSKQKLASSSSTKQSKAKECVQLQKSSSSSTAKECVQLPKISSSSTAKECVQLPEISENSTAKECIQLPKISEAEKSSTPTALVSTTIPVIPIEPKRFYSPVKHQNIFTSPVKLKDIKSPAKSPGRSVKRLFDASDATSDAAPPKKIPAYKRFQHLTEKTPEIIPTSLPQSPSKVGQPSESPCALILPFKLRVLEELFKAVESVTSILYNRKEIITFAKVKSSVLRLVRRVSLKEKHLGQMLAVFPGCYKLTQEKIKASDCNRFVYELVISLNLGDNEKMSASLMTERQRTFHQNLINICLRRHKEFLESLVPPIIVPDDKVVTRWHPKFNIDSMPDITGVALPAHPLNTGPSTARDVINKAQHIIDSANPRMKKALEDLLKKTPSEDSNKSNSSATKDRVDDNYKNSIGALKGISQSLIEKIRAREQLKSIRAVTITPEESKRKHMLGRLPDFVKIFRNVLVAEKKAAVSMDIAVERLSHSQHGSIPPSEIEEHIRMMAVVLPEWIKILTLSQGDYVKIDKTVDINELLDRLKEIIKN